MCHGISSESVLQCWILGMGKGFSFEFSTKKCPGFVYKL